MGKTSNTRTLLIVAIVILGIYVLPSAVAKYAGSHTWEFNATGGVTSLQCGKCHQYIVTEIQSNTTPDAFSAHLAAATNASYVGPGNVINISYTPTDVNNMCWMCHVVQGEFATSLGGTHTKVVIRACTDSDCHGDIAGTGSCTVWDNAHCNVTGRINTSADAHWNFYRPLTKFTSSIGNENTSKGVYDQGYVACLACHTHVGLDLNLTRPQKLSLSMTLLSVSTGWNATDLSVNYSNMTSTTGGKNPGSVWS